MVRVERRGRAKKSAGKTRGGDKRRGEGEGEEKEKESGKGREERERLARREKPDGAAGKPQRRDPSRGIPYLSLSFPSVFFYRLALLPMVLWYTLSLIPPAII